MHDNRVIQYFRNIFLCISEYSGERETAAYKNENIKQQLLSTNLRK